MTNEEWIKSLNTEQLAEQLVETTSGAAYITPFEFVCSIEETPKTAVHKVIEWLKEKHNPDNEFWWSQEDDYDKS